jgi:hypothetical protein
MRPEAVSIPPSRGICRYLMLSVFLMLGVGAVHAQTLVAGLQSSPSVVDFGTQNLNSQTAKQVTIRNSGPSAVTISGITVTGAGFGFSNLTPGTSLGPGQQTVLQVSFKPTSSGTYSGQVTILNSGATSAVSVPLVGTGVSASAAAKTAQMTATSAATTTPAAQAKLSWNASTSPVTGYKVYRGTVSGGPYSTVTSSPISALTYADTNVVAGTTYYYVVTSVNSSGVESVYSNEAIAAVPGGGTTPPPPPPPSSVPTSPVAGMILNGSAKLNGAKLRLTTTSQNLAGSGWFSTPVNIQAFSTVFTFQLTSSSGSGTGTGNGMTFVIQNKGTTAVGPSGGGLGYGPDQPKNPSGSPNSPVTKSVAVKFDLVNNAGEGTNSTGLYLNGASPTTPSVALGGGVNLHSSDIFQANLNYDGKTLTMTVTDTAHTSDKFTTSWAVNIPGTVGANTAYVGFTGGTGSSVANEDILTWTFSNSTASTPPSNPSTVVYKTASLPAVSSGPTFRTFTYAGFPDTTGTILDATKVGNSVTFTVNVATAGTYDIKLGYKKAATRGISQFSINGTNVGATLDQYIVSEAFATVDYGKFTFSKAGNYSFKFAITGKNSKSSSYSVSFDDITLIPQ